MTTQVGQMVVPGAAAQAPQRERLSFFAILVGAFIFAAVTVSAMPGWNYLVKGWGAVLAAGYLIYLLRARGRIGPEVVLFLAWVTWSLTGIFVARSAEVFAITWTTIFQIWVLSAILVGYTDSRPKLSFNLGAFLLGALVVGAYSYMTGDYQRAVVTGERVTGLAVNANSFGWVMLLAVIAMAYFWMLPTRLSWLKYAILLVGMSGAIVATTLTGSRKAVVGLVAFYLAWVWFCYRKDLRRRPAILLTVLMGFSLGTLLLVTFGGETPVGVRFQRTWRGLRGETVTDTGSERLGLYQVAWQVFSEHPLVGVGLNNYRFYTFHYAVAHSEYAEVACDTGLPGFVLYFAIFVVLWRRAGKIAKHSPDRQAVRIANLIRAMLVVVMLLNLGRWNYDSKHTWIIFGVFIGYTLPVWEELRARRGARLEGRLMGAGHVGPG